MEIKFLENLKHCQVETGQTIVLAVSGGIDSATMLDLFAKCGLDLNFVIAHLNHGVREEAIDDEMFVASLSKKYGFPIETKRIAKPETGNLEEELRIERRHFLEEVGEKYKADFIALAHNANDQAETVIFNLLRGAGPAGLGGMSMSKKQIIRPMLNFSRQEIEKYAAKNHIEWHEDITNSDTTLTRNYIRHEILPKFTEISPDWLSSIHRASILQRKIDEHLKKEAEEMIDDGKVEVKILQEIDSPLKYEIYGLLYEKAKGNRRNLTMANFEEVDKIIKNTHGTAKIDLPAGVEAVRNYSLLEFRLKKEDNISLLRFNGKE